MRGICNFMFGISSLKQLFELEYLQHLEQISKQNLHLFSPLTKRKTILKIFSSFDKDVNSHFEGQVGYNNKLVILAGVGQVQQRTEGFY